jgi:hypothetical protein
MSPSMPLPGTTTLWALLAQGTEASQNLRCVSYAAPCSGLGDGLAILFELFKHDKRAAQEATCVAREPCSSALLERLTFPGRATGTRVPSRLRRISGRCSPKATAPSPNGSNGSNRHQRAITVRWYRHQTDIPATRRSHATAVRPKGHRYQTVATVEIGRQETVMTVSWTIVTGPYGRAVPSSNGVGDEQPPSPNGGNGSPPLRAFRRGNGDRSSDR